MRSGFTLFELILVAAIILIIVVIAAPRLQASRIAANEVACVTQCKAYVASQETFRKTDWDGDGIREYALVIGVTNGAWSPMYTELTPAWYSNRARQSLVDCRGEFPEDTFKRAEGEPSGASANQATPKAGYVFRVLHGQNTDDDFLTARPGGSNRENLTAHYGLSAVPSEYEGTGRQQFVVGSRGAVYARDPGFSAGNVHLTRVPPDSARGTWVPVE